MRNRLTAQLSGNASLSLFVSRRMLSRLFWSTRHCVTQMSCHCGPIGRCSLSLNSSILMYVTNWVVCSVVILFCGCSFMVCLNYSWLGIYLGSLFMDWELYGKSYIWIFWLVLFIWAMVLGNNCLVIFSFRYMYVFSMIVLVWIRVRRAVLVCCCLVLWVLVLCFCLLWGSLWFLSCDCGCLLSCSLSCAVLDMVWRWSVKFDIDWIQVEIF